MFGWLWTAIASATATMTFFGIFLVGIAFSLFSLVMGGHGDGEHDFMGHDVHHDTGHHDDGHDGDSSIFNVGFLSVRGMALLSTGFGGVGFLVQVYTGKVLFSTLSGLLFGYVFAFAVLSVMKMFKAQQSNSLIAMDNAKGQEATVVTSIPQGGAGEIRFELSGQEFVKMAYSASGSPIRSGSRVRIDQVSGGSMTVSLIV
jgi:membrane protein implicated in regulation of membrane protease activity